jgi:hypothetical protein
MKHNWGKNQALKNIRTLLLILVFALTFFGITSQTHADQGSVSQKAVSDYLAAQKMQP